MKKAIKKNLKNLLSLVLVLALALSTINVGGIVTANAGTIETALPDGLTATPTKTATWNEQTNEATVKFEVNVGKVSELQTEVSAADIVLVIDASGSMSGDRIKNVKASAIKFVEDIMQYDGIRIAVVAYNENAWDVVDASSKKSGFLGKENKDVLKSSINSIGYVHEWEQNTTSGGTNIQAGIRAAEKLFENSTAAKKLMVVLSDGEPTYSYRGTEYNTSTKLITAFNYNSSVGNGEKYIFNSYEIEESTNKEIAVTWKNSNKSGWYNEADERVAKNNKNISNIKAVAKYKVSKKEFIDVEWKTVNKKTGWYAGTSLKEDDFRDDEISDISGTATYTYTETKTVATVSNHGLATVSEAALAAAAGIDVYTIAFGVPDDNNAASVLADIAKNANGTAYTSTTDETSLKGVFDQIVKSAPITLVSDVEIVDYIADTYFDEAPTNVKINDTVAVLGTDYTYDAKDHKITLKLTNLSEGKHVLQYNIKLTADAKKIATTLKADEQTGMYNVPTNESATLNYKYEGTAVTPFEFANPELPFAVYSYTTAYEVVAMEGVTPAAVSGESGYVFAGESVDIKSFETIRNSAITNPEYYKYYLESNLAISTTNATAATDKLSAKITGNNAQIYVSLPVTAYTYTVNYIVEGNGGTIAGYSSSTPYVAAKNEQISILSFEKVLEAAGLAAYAGTAYSESKMTVKVTGNATKTDADNTKVQITGSGAVINVNIPINTCNIEYHDEGGVTKYPVETVKYGAVHNMLGGYDKADSEDGQFHYDFLGWYEDGDSTESLVTGSVEITEDKTYIAKFDEITNTFTVTFEAYAADKTSVLPDTELGDMSTVKTVTEVPWGTAIGIDNMPTEADYTTKIDFYEAGVDDPVSFREFTGWSEGGKKVPNPEASLIIANTTFTANYESANYEYYDVILMDGETPLATERYEYTQDSPAALADIYTDFFSKKSETVNGIGNKDTDTAYYTFTGFTSLSYTFTRGENGNVTPVAPGIVAEVKVDGNNIIINVAYNTTPYVTMTFVPEVGTQSQYKVLSGTATTVNFNYSEITPASNEREINSFSGWFMNITDETPATVVSYDTTLTENNTTFTITEDTTVYAKHTTVYKQLVTFLDEGGAALGDDNSQMSVFVERGTAYSAMELLSAATAKAKDKAPKKNTVANTYTFKEWTIKVTDEQGIEKYVSAENILKGAVGESDITFYASYDPTPVQYTVTFLNENSTDFVGYTDGGNAYTLKVKVDYGTEFTSEVLANLLSNAKAAADKVATDKSVENVVTWSFAGWTNSDKEAVTPSGTVTTDLTFIASYSDEKIYTVTFHVDEEADSAMFDEQHVKENEKATEPTEKPVKASESVGNTTITYTFGERWIEWVEDVQNPGTFIQKTVDFDTPITEDKDYYPVWIENTTINIIPGPIEIPTEPNVIPEPEEEIDLDIPVVPEGQPEEELDEETTETPEAAPEEETGEDEVVEEEEIEEETEEEIIDLEEVETPEGEAEETLPQTGTAPLGVFYGIGTACIIMGGAIILGFRRKEEEA